MSSHEWIITIVVVVAVAAICYRHCYGQSAITTAKHEGETVSLIPFNYMTIVPTRCLPKADPTTFLFDWTSQSNYNTLRDAVANNHDIVSLQEWNSVRLLLRHMHEVDDITPFLRYAIVVVNTNHGQLLRVTNDQAPIQDKAAHIDLSDFMSGISKQKLGSL